MKQVCGPLSLHKYVIPNVDERRSLDQCLLSDWKQTTDVGCAHIPHFLPTVVLDPHDARHVCFTRSVSNGCLSGFKHLTRCPPACVCSSDPTVASFTLVPGDVMYIPRGWSHVAVALSSQEAVALSSQATQAAPIMQQTTSSVSGGFNTLAHASGLGQQQASRVKHPAMLAASPQDRQQVMTCSPDGVLPSFPGPPAESCLSLHAPAAAAAAAHGAAAVARQQSPSSCPSLPAESRLSLCMSAAATAAAHGGAHQQQQRQ